MYEKVSERELKISEIFNIAFEIFKQNIKPIFLITLISYAFLAGVALLHSTIASDVNSWIFILSSIIFFSVSFIAPLVPAALTTIISKKTIDEEEVLLGDIMGFFKKIPKFFVTLLLYAACLFPLILPFVVAILVMAEAGTYTSLYVTILFFLVAIIYIAVSFYFLTNIVAVTDKWGFSALKESFRLVKGKWFKTFIFIILSSLFVLMFDGNLAGFGAGTFQIVVGSLISALAGGFFVTAQCVWFLNRVRSSNVERE